MSRGVLPGADGFAMEHPYFGRSFYPISPRGTDYSHLITNGTPGFSDLLNALMSRIIVHADYFNYRNSNHQSKSR